jgi:hypothetical protein
MECRMVTAEFSEWSCQISVRKTEGIRNVALAKTEEIKFGPLIRHPDLVEPMLRKAQLAALNPHMNVEELIRFDLKAYDKTGQDGNPPGPISPDQLSFTKNVTCITLRGPKVLNLTFIDLPGAFVAVLACH